MKGNGVSQNQEGEEEALPRAVAEAIERAFCSLSYPGDGGLTTAPGHPEAQEVADAFRGKHWKDVSLDMLFAHRLSLPLLSNEAFRFYLPAYLLAAVLHADEVDTLRENVFYMLTPPTSEPQASSFAERIKGLDTAQTGAVQRFVELYHR
ncbi:MAG: DUF6714 family protein [Polyangiaceae bacterium]